MIVSLLRYRGILICDSMKRRNIMFYLVQSCLLGYTAVLNDCRPTFQRCVLPPSSGMSEHHTRRRENLKSHMFYLELKPASAACRGNTSTLCTQVAVLVAVSPRIIYTYNAYDVKIKLSCYVPGASRHCMTHRQALAATATKIC
jgi:hypothetical protein